MAAAIYLAMQSQAATTIEDIAATASQDGAVKTGGDGDTAGTAVVPVASMKLEPTGVNVPAYDGILIDTLTCKVDTSVQLNSDATLFGLQYMKIKWRGFTEVTMSPNTPNGSPGSASGGEEKVTTMSAAGEYFWFNKWAIVTTWKNGDDSKKFINGLSFTACDVMASGYYAVAADVAAKCVTKSAYANNYAGRGASDKSTLTADMTDLVGPIVSFQALGVAQVWKIKAQVVTNLCLNAKLVVTAAWTAAPAAVDYAASGTLDVAVADTTLGTHRPRHNMDVPGWTECDLHFACPAANADDCAGTATTGIKFPKTRATLTAGKAVKVLAFVSTNLWSLAATDHAGYGAEGTATVIIHADCALIVAVTAPADAALKVEAGKTYTQAAAFTHTKSALWTQAGMCGELTALTGDSKAWVTWASDVATIVVPKDAKSGTEVVTVTRSYPTAAGHVGSATAASTATGAMKLTLTVTGAGGSGAGSAGGVADVAGTAAAVVAGVLGGTVFAAAFLPSPPTPSAPAAAGGAAPASEQ